MSIEKQWQELQDREWNNYLVSPVGIFSVEGLRGAEMAGEQVKRFIPGGLCLDIGSGALPLPYYMTVAEGVRFIGIDPYKGNRKRKYEFIQGLAEELPFRSRLFDGVLFATSLDHVKDPARAVSEAYRVLKRKGYLFFWGGLKDDDEKYQKWLNAEKPVLYELHLWAFTYESIMKVFKRFTFIESMKVNKQNNETIMIFEK